MSNMNKPHRTFTPEFKLSVVQSYLSGEMSVAQLTCKYDLGERVLRRWVTKFQAGGEDALLDQRGRHGKHAGGRPKVKYDSELERLRQENLRLKGENFLLKKLDEYLKKQRR